MNKKSILIALFTVLCSLGTQAFGQVKSDAGQFQPSISSRGPSEDPTGPLPTPVFVSSGAGKTVTFRLPDYQTGIDAEYIYNFGDGNQSYSASPDRVHTYSDYGTFLVTVVVIREGQKVSFSAPVQVHPVGPGNSNSFPLRASKTFR